MLIIQKGVKIPPIANRGRSACELYGVLRQMQTNDSVFVPCTGRHIANVRNIAGRVRPERFTVRTVTEGGVKGLRIWRIA